MQMSVMRMSLCFLIVVGVVGVCILQAQQDDGPLGLRWGMSNTDAESLGIRLCCKQVGKWGVRYEIEKDALENLPDPLGDENKVYLYFGNMNKLLRIYIDIIKRDGRNRYNQINTMLESNYTFQDGCVQREDKYTELQKNKTCGDYYGYANYAKDAIKVFVGLERFAQSDRVSIILLHDKLYSADQGKKSPL